MRITRLELKNFRTFSHLVIEDIPDIVVLVSPNGLGKTSILEAIVGAHELVSPYFRDDYPFSDRMPDGGRTTGIWPPDLPSPLKIGTQQAEVMIDVKANEREAKALPAYGCKETTGRAHLVIEQGRHVTAVDADNSVTALFRYHPAKEGFGLVDYIPSVRLYSRTTPGDIANTLSDSTTRSLFRGFGESNVMGVKFHTVKSFIGVSGYREKLSRSSFRMGRARN